MPGLPKADLTLEDRRLTTQLTVLGFDLIQPRQQAGNLIQELSIDCQQLCDRKARRRGKKSVVHDTRILFQHRNSWADYFLKKHAFGEYLRSI